MRPVAASMRRRAHGELPRLGGWYYDNNNAPKNIILCPLSCNKVSAAPEGSKINLLFGCETEVIPG